jgi:hypothetical protein
VRRIALEQSAIRSRARLARALRRGGDGASDAVDRLLRTYVDDVRRQMRRIAASELPVLVGPFDGEVGFELLYWMPLVRWLVHEFPQLRGRIVVLSRGGVDAWYEGLDARYVDLYAVAEPDEVRARRVSTKQQEVGDFDREIYGRVRAHLGLGATHEIHPSVFFGIYYKLLKLDRYAFARSVAVDGGVSRGLLAEYVPLAPPPLDLDAELPDEFVAVRFYFRPSFPDTSEIRRFARGVVESLAAHLDVVLLNTGLELDDHLDLVLPRGHSRVHTIDHLVTPASNLAVQTAIIARSCGFVGTYGGLAYLPPYLGVRSIGFNALPEHTFHPHLELAERIFDCGGFGEVLAIAPAAVPLLGLLGAADRGATMAP